MIALKIDVSDKILDIAKTLNTKTFLAAVHKAASDVGKQFLEALKEATPVDTGTARESWYLGVVSKRNTISTIFTLDVPYGRVLEKGSVIGRKPWPSVGPKTVLYWGRIYSSQAPGGISRKALKKISKEEFKQKLLAYFKW